MPNDYKINRRRTHPDVAAVETVLAQGGQSALLEWAKHNPAAFYRAWAEIAPASVVRATLAAVTRSIAHPMTLH